MKKLFSSIFAGIARFFTFHRDDPSNEKVIVSFGTNRVWVKNVEQLMATIGAPDLTFFLPATVGLTRHVAQRLDKGYVIITIDPTSLDYSKTDVRNVFPNLAVTSIQDLGRLDAAIDHYHWCVRQVEKGAKVGAFQDNLFEESPVFKIKR